jgi:hypothetical protein
MKCPTCQRVVDYDAATCPGCGKPQPGKAAMEQLTGMGGCLIVLIAIGGVVRLCSGGDTAVAPPASAPIATEQPPSATGPSDLVVESTESAEQPAELPPLPADALQAEVAQESEFQPEENSSAGLNEDRKFTDKHESSGTPPSGFSEAATQDSPSSARSNEYPAVPSFFPDAVIDDKDGYAILRSRPAKSSDNVGRLDSGTRVQRLSDHRRWREIRTEDGRIGFVLERQLKSY